MLDKRAASSFTCSFVSNTAGLFLQVALGCAMQCMWLSIIILMNPFRHKR